MRSESRHAAADNDLGDMISRIVEETVSAAVGRAESATQRAVDRSSRGSHRDRQDLERHVVCEAGTPVRVRNRAGGITLRAGDGDGVTVVARGEYRGPLDELLVARVDDGVVVIEVVDRGVRGLRNATLDVTVPSGSPVDVSTGAGAIDIHDVDADIRCACGAGRVRTHGTRGAVVVKTGAGAVELTDVRGPVTVDSGVGAVVVDGTLSGGSAIRAGLGRVEVRIPADSNLKVAARASKVANDFGLPVLNGAMAGVIGSGADGTLKVQARGVVALRRT